MCIWSLGPPMASWLHGFKSVDRDRSMCHTKQEDHEVSGRREMPSMCRLNQTPGETALTWMARTPKDSAESNARQSEQLMRYQCHSCAGRTDHRRLIRNHLYHEKWRPLLGIIFIKSVQCVLHPEWFHKNPAQITVEWHTGGANIYKLVLHGVIFACGRIMLNPFDSPSMGKNVSLSYQGPSKPWKINGFTYKNNAVC